jgi:hypothetical protein
LIGVTAVGDGIERRQRPAGFAGFGKDNRTRHLGANTGSNGDQQVIHAEQRLGIVRSPSAWFHCAAIAAPL